MKATLKNTRKLIKKLFISVVLSIVMAVNVFAWTPYEGYTYNSFNESQPSQNGYEATEVINIDNLPDGKVYNPVDMFFTDDKLYIVDSGDSESFDDPDSKIIILDKDFKVINIITSLNNNGKSEHLMEATSIFVKKDGSMLISEKGRNRVAYCTPEGKITQLFFKPQDELFPQDIEFKPKKVIVDSTDEVYVLCEGFFYGAIRYSKTGKFKGFFGANPVSISLQQLTDKIWRRVLSKDQRNYMRNYVPMEFSSLTVDKDDFIYTTTMDNTSFREQVKKLNLLGRNILKPTEEFGAADKSVFGDRERLIHNNVKVYTQLIDISVSESYLITVLDSGRNRIFRYDQECNMLFSFGGKGDKKGLFDTPTAVETIEDNVFVLDSARRSITVFKPTEFGANILNAIRYYSNGFFKEAKEPWEEVLKKDQNYELAYTGIGKALMQEKQYQQAMHYFKLGNDKYDYSKAAKIVRADAVKHNFLWITIITAAFIALLLSYKKLLNLLSYAIFKKNYEPTMENPFYVMMHPLEGFDTIRRKSSKKSSITSVAIVSSLFLATIVQQQGTGFIFNNSRPEDFNVFVVLVRTVGLILFFASINWAISTLSDGEGCFSRIFNVTAYSLMPYIILMILTTVLSNFLIFEEGVMLNWLLMFGELWSIFLIFNAIKEVHQFSGGKTLFNIILTLLGMVFVIFLLFLIFNVLQQLMTFIYTIVNELIMRS